MLRSLNPKNKMEDFDINNSTCYKFLKSTGLRASKDAMTELQKKLKTAGLDIVKAAAETATAAGRKTILPQDLTN